MCDYLGGKQMEFLGPDKDVLAGQPSVGKQDMEFLEGSGSQSHPAKAPQTTGNVDYLRE